MSSLTKQTRVAGRAPAVTPPVRLLGPLESIPADWLAMAMSGSGPSGDGRGSLSGGDALAPMSEPTLNSIDEKRNSARDSATGVPATIASKRIRRIIGIRPEQPRSTANGSRVEEFLQSPTRSFRQVGPLRLREVTPRPIGAISRPDLPDYRRRDGKKDPKLWNPVRWPVAPMVDVGLCAIDSGCPIVRRTSSISYPRRAFARRSSNSGRTWRKYW